MKLIDLKKKKKKILEQKKLNNNNKEIKNQNENYNNLNNYNNNVNKRNNLSINQNEYYNNNYNKKDNTKVPIPNFKKIKYTKINNDLKKYPNTSKTILGYNKFRKVKQFSFENSFKRSGSGNLSNRYFNNGKIFNNYTSIQGGYFDSSLQNGGESKLSYLNNSMIYHNKLNQNFKNCHSPVKDYIENKVNVFI